MTDTAVPLGGVRVTLTGDQRVELLLALRDRQGVLNELMIGNQRLGDDVVWIKASIANVRVLVDMFTLSQLS